MFHRPSGRVFAVPKEPFNYIKKAAPETGRGWRWCRNAPKRDGHSIAQFNHLKTRGENA